MKNRKKENGLKNDNWESPKYIFDFVGNYFDGKDFFDPCPLAIDNGGGYEIQFDGLSIDWKERNYVEPTI